MRTPINISKILFALIFLEIHLAISIAVSVSIITITGINIVKYQRFYLLNIFVKIPANAICNRYIEKDILPTYIIKFIFFKFKKKTAAPNTVAIATSSALIAAYFQYEIATPLNK